MRIIVDVKYENSDLNKIMTKIFQHLNVKWHKRLLILLNKFEDMFGSTFGTWNTTPVYLELNDDVKPVWSLPYPVPRLHEAMFRNEFERLVRLVVLEESNEFKWEAPSFSQPKAKTNHVIFLSDFQNLNRQLKWNPYPIPKMRGMLLKLECFQCATSLDLNMGYCHIRLS